MDKKQFEQTLSALEEMPEKVALLVQGLPRPTQTRKPSPDSFSILENFWHLRDIEVEGYLVRIQRLLGETAPVLADVDGSRLAAERSYNELELQPAIDGLSAARAEGIRSLRREGPSALERTGILETVGPITLNRLLEIMLEHDQGHMHEISELIRASKIDTLPA